MLKFSFSPLWSLKYKQTGLIILYTKECIKLCCHFVQQFPYNCYWSPLNILNNSNSEENLKGANIFFHCAVHSLSLEVHYIPQSPHHTTLFPPALPRQRIELQFDQTFYIEASFECRFDHIEVRDGPFSFSPLINRFCGSASPGLVLSSGRFMWIRFFSDEELEGVGFKVQYSFTAGDLKHSGMVY